MKVGSGFDPEVTCGPMINSAAVTNIDRLVQSAINSGASAVTGGSAIDGPGFFYEPTVLGGVDMAAPITREEIFGPVAPVTSFTDTDAMIAAANDTEMGLIGYVFTEDPGQGPEGLRAHRGRHGRAQPGRGVRTRPPPSAA